MIKRLILKKQSFVQLTVAVLGALFGLTMLLASYQVYIDIKGMLESKKDLIGKQFLIINKKVSVFNTLSMSSSGFSERDIKEIKEIEAVKDVAQFTANRFHADVVTRAKQNGIPPVNVDLFFESIPDEFLDVKPDEWHWEETDERVPIIIPNDYINLFNFGFAPSRGLPQIAKGSVSLFNFQVRIIHQGKEIFYDANIVGFSDRVNSILVPKTFIDYANEKYGRASQPTEPSRLIVVSDDPTDPKLLELLDKKGYETNSELLRNSKLTSLLRVVLSVVTVIGFVIIMLAILGFIQYAQILIGRSSYEIRTLSQLGYYYTTIARQYISFYAIVFVIIGLLSVGLVFLVKNYFTGFAKDRGFDIEAGVSNSVFAACGALLLLFMILQTLGVLLQVRRLAKPGR